ncbi:MAG: DUF4252 domain-containing protein [Prevotellaceae bacterium]|jgi:hypothetical protein|nr:DUF4252 domain-containing protein [Prevotellaceae bacterium]
MKRISLFTAVLLFASVAGSAQKAVIEGTTDTFDLAKKIQDGETKLFSEQQMLKQRIWSERYGILEIFLQELSRKKGVTAITITKPLLDIMPEIHSYIEDSGMDIQKVIPKLEQIDVFKSKDEEAKKFMRNSPTSRGGNEVLMRGNEVLMRIKNEKENISIYGNIDGNNAIRSIIMFSDNEEECVLIRIMGLFDRNELKQIIKIKGRK